MRIASVTPSSQTFYIEKMTYHFPCRYACVVVGPDRRCAKSVQVYLGYDSAEHFLEQMMHDKETFGRILIYIKPIRISSEEQKASKEAKFYSICKEPLH